MAVQWSYDGDAVVVDVCLLVKLLLDLSVLDLRPGDVLSVLQLCLWGHCLGQ